jgi:thioesterase domain-containing protein
LPYVVVVATSGGQKSTVYFRKFLIGVLAHGFDRWAFANTLSSVSLVSIPVWETNMARTLKSLDNYDDAIAFNWTQTCTLPKPDMAVHAGHDLAAEVQAKLAIRSQHPGDVVDLHFIGYSRGAVVVAEAIKAMASKDPLLGGGFVQVTLLDPHPANNCFKANCPSDSTTDSTWGSFARDSKDQLTESARVARARAMDFQKAASDPPITISPGVKKVEVWFQHTPASCFSARPGVESQMNLWGMVDSQALIDQSGQLTQPTEKTNCPEAIGHNQIPTLYQTQIVETGKLNREPQ